MNYFQKSIALHHKLKGKIQVSNKVNIINKNNLSLFYTPGVGAVSRRIADNNERVWDLTWKNNSVAIVSDGTAVLGLGKIGPEAALPVMEGKAMIFKQFAGIDAVPIVLDAEDPDEIVKIIKAIAPGFGGINLEDISAPRCFYIEERLKEELNIPVMHDDQHGTAIVVLAALINALKVVKKDIKNSKIVVSGAGAAGVAVIKLLKLYGAGNIIALDSKGAIYLDRQDLQGYKKQLAEATNLGCHFNSSLKCEIGDLGSTIHGADVFIGVSAPNILSQGMARTMAAKSIIFALSNPIPEIMPNIAKKAGAFIVATGRSDFPNQINNALVFPGVFRGALDARVKNITDNMKIKAAESLASIIKRPTVDCIIPSIFDKMVVKTVANAIR